MTPHDEEAEKVNEVNRKLHAEQEVFPTWWTETDTLRFLHEFKFDQELTVEKIRDHFRWLRNVPGLKISGQSKYMIETGVLYQLGRDKQYRPNIYLVLKKIKDVSTKIDFIIDALLHMLVMVRERMMLSYYIEKWNLIVDCSGTNSLTSEGNILSKIYQAVRNNFPETLNKVYLLEAGIQAGIEAQLNPFQGGTLKEKVIMIESAGGKELDKYISQDQREQKYGGSYQDSISFWPPQGTYNGNIVNKSSAQKKNLFFFKMHEKDMYGSNVGAQSEYRQTSGTTNSMMVENKGIRASMPQRKIDLIQTLETQATLRLLRPT